MSPPARAPIGFLAAAAWSIVATFAFQLLATIAGRPGPGGLDIVAGVACQAAAFLFVLWLVLRVHAPDRPLGDALAMRPVSLPIVLLAILAGVALQPPITWLGQLVDGRFPVPEDEEAARAALLFAPTVARKVGVVATVAIVGPLVEELFFRGGLFGALRRAHPRGASLAAVAVFFAAAHQEPRYFAPILVVGLALGWVRAASGSIWPGFAMHAAFNGVSALAAVTAATAEDLAHDDPVPAWLALAGLAAAAALLALAGRLARGDAQALAARLADEG